MFIVLLRRAEPDLEKLIYALSRSASSAQPAAGEKTGEKSQLMIAQNSIDDTVISRLRGNVLARDLVFEKVNDDAPVNTSGGGRRKEKAVMYVATPNRLVNARVVVDLDTESSVAGASMCIFAICLLASLAFGGKPPAALHTGAHRMEITLERYESAGKRSSALVLDKNDKIRFKFKANFPGYLYVTNQSTSATSLLRVFATGHRGE